MPISGSFSTSAGGGGSTDSPPVNLAALSGGGTIDEVTIFKAGSTSCSVTRLWTQPTDTVTADDSNYAAFEFFLRTSDGTQSDTTTASTKITGGSGDIDPFDVYTVTVAWTVAAGGSITMTVSSVGTGAFPRAAYGAY